MTPEWALAALAIILAGANAILIVNVRHLIRKVGVLERHVGKMMVWHDSLHPGFSRGETTDRC